MKLIFGRWTTEHSLWPIVRTDVFLNHRVQLHACPAAVSRQVSAAYR